MMRLMLIFALCIALPLQAQAAKELTIDLANDQVDISTGFNGANLVLFGTYKPKTEIVVVLEGPRKNMAVRQKSRTLGMWMNAKHHVFKDVPSFYSYAQGKEGAEGYAVSELLKKRHKISAEHFTPRSDAFRKKDDEYKVFKAAFIRNQRAAGMYPEAPEGITFLSDRLFKTSIYMPSNVPKGDYTIITYMLKGNTLLETAQTRLRVAQVGNGAQINSFAKSYGFLYGILCIMVALFAGWGINAVRRKS